MANSFENGTGDHLYAYDSESEYGYFSSNYTWPCSYRFPYLCSVSISAICIAVIGILGNLAVIVSLIRGKLYKKSSHMSILVLAITDIMFLVVFIIQEFIYFPNEFYLKRFFSAELCVIIFVMINTPMLELLFEHYLSGLREVCFGHQSVCLYGQTYTENRGHQGGYNFHHFGHRQPGVRHHHDGPLSMP